MEDVVKFKDESTEIMKDAGFELHKWHSNCPDVESTSNQKECETTYAETLVGNLSIGETKLLGLPWDKKIDVVTINFASCIEVTKPIAKRKVIAAINSVYDILGWSSPVLITAKIIFAEICLLKKHWDEQLPDEIVEKWLVWIKHLQQQSSISVPRSVVAKKGDLFEIHGFFDASKVAICGAVYVIEYCENQRVNQRLLVAKSRVAPKDGSIPRLELIAALMLVRLQTNLFKALKNINIRTVFNWVDSITVLHWLANKGTYSVFVRNRVKQINEMSTSKWLYVPTKENPSDVGTRGSPPNKLGELWFEVPKWLSCRDQWPVQPLPVFRTQMTHPFAVSGVDFAGLMLYRTNKKKTQKAYIVLFTCTTTRAVHLKLCKSMTAEEFKRSLKEFVARRGTPNKLVSDNALTFKATNQWLHSLTQDENLFNYLNTQRIEWSFNLARAPWWGGFYERMVGIMKASLLKVISRALLKYEELEEALLDIECFMNNRPLCYQEEEIEHPVLTPNLLIHGTTAQFLDEDLEAFDEKDLVTKRMKFLKTCRRQLRKRWQAEYLHALEERHRKTVGKEEKVPTKGSVVIITDDSKIKTKWQIGRIVDTIKGKDGVLRGYKIKTGTGYVVERPLQLVCDLEIKGSKDEKASKNKDMKENDEVANENKDTATEIRPQRRAKTAAMDMIKGVSFNELED